MKPQTIVKPEITPQPILRLRRSPGTIRKNIRQLLKRLLPPLRQLTRMNLVLERDLIDALFAFERQECDLGLKFRTVPLPFPDHFYPLFWTQFYPENLT
jgi:hypothetical protein